MPLRYYQSRGKDVVLTGHLETREERANSQVMSNLGWNVCFEMHPGILVIEVEQNRQVQVRRWLQSTVGSRWSGFQATRVGIPRYSPCPDFKLHL